MIKRKKVGITLKSGKEIVIVCDKMTWRVGSNGNIVSYEMEQLAKSYKPSLNYCNPTEIAAIITYSEDYDEDCT